MANNCYYQAHIAGTAQNVHELVKMMRWEDDYENDGLGWIFSVNCIEEKKIGNVVIAVLDGDCAWSAHSSMIECACKRNLLTETRSLGLRFEVYCEELGIGFQEHIVVDRGVIKVYDEVDYLSIDLSDLYPEEIEEICEKNQLNKNDWLATADDGYLTVGGFPDWEFSDPIEIDSIETYA